MTAGRLPVELRGERRIRQTQDPTSNPPPAPTHTPTPTLFSTHYLTAVTIQPISFRRHPILLQHPFCNIVNPASVAPASRSSRRLQPCDKCFSFTLFSFFAFFSILRSTHHHHRHEMWKAERTCPCSLPLAMNSHFQAGSGKKAARRGGCSAHDHSLGCAAETENVCV